MTMWNRTPLLLFALALSAPACALGENGADKKKIADGRMLARHVCSACHDIGGDKPWSPTLQPAAPNFTTLARQHKLDADFLRGFLVAPHGGRERKMPNPQLLDYQIDNLLAYLRATRRTR